VHNAGYVWPGKRWRKFPGSIRVCIGPIIESEGKKTSQLHRRNGSWSVRDGQLPKENGFPFFRLKDFESGVFFLKNKHKKSASMMRFFVSLNF